MSHLMETLGLNTKSTGPEIGSSLGVSKIWTQTEVGQSSEEGEFREAAGQE